MMVHSGAKLNLVKSMYSLVLPTRGAGGVYGCEVGSLPATQLLVITVKGPLMTEQACHQWNVHVGSYEHYYCRFHYWDTCTCCACPVMETIVSTSVWPNRPKGSADCPSIPDSYCAGVVFGGTLLQIVTASTKTDLNGVLYSTGLKRSN